MELHDRAWEGFKIVVLGKTPLLPMRIEQAVAEAMPSMEVQVSSFETYDEAFQFCKEQGDVGFFFLSEDCGESPFLSVFRELSAQFVAYGLPAFGVIFHESEPKAFSARAIGKTPTLLDYVPAEQLVESSGLAHLIKNLWESLVESYEKTVFSKDLQASIVSAAEESLGSDGVSFLSRLNTNLTSDLNLSWLESVAAKWIFFLDNVEKVHPAIIKPHEHLNFILKEYRGSAVKSSTDLTSMLGSQTSLPKKIFILTNWIEDLRKTGNLEAGLAEISLLSKPGAPKLIRHLGKNQARILEFAKDVSKGFQRQA